MTASEFSFLAFGLILGLVTGAALVELIRARPREVRLTVSHDAIPRRSTTLADDAFTTVGPEPARGGPGDRRTIGIAVMDPTMDRRTHVLNGRPPEPVPLGADPRSPAPGRILEPAFPLRTSTPASVSDSRMIGIPVSDGEDPRLDIVGAESRMRASVGAYSAPGNAQVGAALAAVAPISASATAARIERNVPRSGGTAGFGRPGMVGETMDRAQHAPPAQAATATESAVTLRRNPTAAPEATAARPIAHFASPGGPGVEATAGPAAEATAGPAEPTTEPSVADPSAGQPCPEMRLLADERCELATRARAQATSAAETLRAAQRTYDAHEAAAVTATWRADPRAVHDAKDAAQGGFRAAVASATTPDQLEAAARDWLTDINRINTEAKDATATAKREHATAATIGATLERLGLEADAARISAENADAACL
ncbi:MAG: hypothetical protein H0T59_03695, partial [Chloroflexi bacterium]|nr:hypothetical protein [Chloroflexota bacterium]